VIDVAFIAPASAFSGGTVRSLLAITHQDGLVLHAAVVIVAPKTAAAVGPCVAVNSCFSLSGRSWASLQRFPLRSLSENLQHPPGLRYLAEPAEKVW
jgi:hypothetical protein